MQLSQPSQTVNCSTDRSLEIALNYAKKDGRIRVESNRQFLGVIANHNTAFRLISPDSKYCKVVSADDWLFPECLARMVARCRSESIRRLYWMLSAQWRSRQIARFQVSEDSVFRPGIMPGTFQERARIWIRQSDVTLIQS
jgi:glycosyltransferase involved in cell wall biosynthesis